MTAPETTATEATEAMTLTAARESITDASQVVMDAYETGLLIEVLLDDLCQHRLSYEESPDAIDKEYLHIGEVCEHLTRLTRIMRAYWVAEKASAGGDSETSPGAGTETGAEGLEKATGRAGHRHDANGHPPAINP